MNRQDQAIVGSLHIAGYRIERELGRGGMATVYLAHQESLRRPVALKIMSPALLQDPGFASRFLQEGATVARLMHPNIIKIYDSGIHENTYYLAMEYLPGGSLRDRIRQGLDPEQGVDILYAMADALSYAHRRDIIHRDIKPQNILHYEDGTPILTDFGIAKLLGNTTSLTVSGYTLGTPSYMSPEQARGQPVDARADIYALGILFFEMLTGRVPYTAPDSVALAIKHITEPLPRLPSQFALYQPLLDDMLAKQPDERLPSAGAVLDRLAELGVVSGMRRGLSDPRMSKPKVAPATAAARRSARGRWLTMGTLSGLIGIGLAAGIAKYGLPGSHPPAADVTRQAGEQQSVELAAPSPPRQVEPRLDEAPQPDPPVDVQRGNLHLRDVDPGLAREVNRQRARCLFLYGTFDESRQRRLDTPGFVRCTEQVADRFQLIDSNDSSKRCRLDLQPPVAGSPACSISEKDYLAWKENQGTEQAR